MTGAKCTFWLLERSAISKTNDCLLFGFLVTFQRRRKKLGLRLKMNLSMPDETALQRDAMMESIISIVIDLV